MAPAKPLLALLDALRVDAGERFAYERDPEGYLASHGWADLDPSELRDALGFAREAMPLDIAVTIPDSVESLDHYVAAVAPLADDLEDFGADAVPLDVDLDLDPPVALDGDPTAPALDEEPLTVDLGPDDDLVVDDDEDDDGDLDLDL